MLRKASRFWIIAALALSTSLVTASWGRANERATDFNIPPQSLDSALLTFAKQAGAQVSVSTIVIAGMKTAGIAGTFTPSTALTKLLSETGLQFTTVGDRTYALAKTDADSAAPGRRMPEQTKFLAPVDAAPTSPSAADNGAKKKKQPSENAEASGELTYVELGDILVTGTSIRGQAPVGSQLIVIGRAEIEEGGFSTAQDVIRSLPQNFSGGASEEGTSRGVEASGNISRGTGLNLRGLGPSSTLVLINGRRLTGSGLQANFVDVSNIPLTAIERIEVLTDGASAIYGSDAIGGVVNYVLRSGFEGAETRARVGSVTSGDTREYQIGQALGTAWESGHALLSLEYYDRESLAANTRDLTADSDLRRLGGDDFSVPLGNPGTITIGEQTWAIPRGQDGQSLQPSDLIEGAVNLQNTNEGSDLLPRQSRRGAYANLSQRIGTRLELFVEGLYTTRDTRNKGLAATTTVFVPDANPFYVNPTGDASPISVGYSFTDDLGPRIRDANLDSVNAALGAKFEVGRNWQVTLSGGYGSEDVMFSSFNELNFAALEAALADANPATALNVFGDGSFTNPDTLDGLRTSTSSDLDSELLTSSITATGPVTGHVKLAVGVEYLEPSFSSSLTQDGFTTPTPRFSRQVKAAFAEVFVPVFGADNRRRGLERLDLSIAGRTESYSDFGSTTNPKFGVAWAPVPDLTLRGTWGTSYKAPNLADLDESPGITGSVIAPLTDPSASSGFSDVLLVFGKNADLKEETATAWSLGVDVAPAALPNLTIGLSYFHIDFKDRIQDPPLAGSFLIESERFAGLITRNPTAAQRAEACSHGVYFLGTPEDCLNTPIDAIVDLRIRNTSIVKTSGLDLMGTYEFSTNAGTFGLDLNASYLLDFSEAESQDVSPLLLVDRANNPLRFRMRDTFSWMRGPLAARVFINHFGSYRDNLSTPNRRIGSWTTADVQFSYRIEDRPDSWMDRITIALNGQNVFDENPPFFNNPDGIGYDQENADPLGRFVSVQFRKEW